jgi:hypothetical protein
MDTIRVMMIVRVQVSKVSTLVWMIEL